MSHIIYESYLSSLRQHISEQRNLVLLLIEVGLYFVLREDYSYVDINFTLLE